MPIIWGKWLKKTFYGTYIFNSSTTKKITKLISFNVIKKKNKEIYRVFLKYTDIAIRNTILEAFLINEKSGNVLLEC